jgi:hypothetical protein
MVVSAVSVASAAWMGLLVGARHAFEPDHLAAVATLAADGDGAGSRWRAALPGALWGLGHTAALLGVVVILLLLGAVVPPAIEAALELGVALMLVILGVRGLVLAARGLRSAAVEGRMGPAHLHAHGGAAHVHPGPALHLHLRSTTLAVRPLWVGMVHGLAGSGALLSAAALAMPSTAGRVGYALAFGLGSMLGMGALTGLLGLPLRAALASPRGQARLQAVMGLASLSVGLVWGAAALA